MQDSGSKHMKNRQIRKPVRKPKSGVAGGGPIHFDILRKTCRVPSRHRESPKGASSGRGGVVMQNQESEIVDKQVRQFSEKCK